MKTLRSHSRRLLRIQSLTWMALVACLLALWGSVAKSDNGPGISILSLTNDQFSLTVTNGSSTNQYEIQRREAFDELHPWNYEVGGTTGQTNFTVDMGIQQIGFFRAIPCVDCDHDGYDNWLDANPNDPAVGILTITIDSPLNGSTVN